MLKHKLVIRFYFVALLVGLTASVFPTVCLAADDIPRISIQELKAKMDKAENITILDVRSGEDYQASKYKITGAIRIPLDQLASRSNELSSEKEIIAYCA